jgi:acyl-coenzyme A thioesterase PaaI-like protein
VTGHPFVTPQRERLAEAIRHLVDATMTVEDATEEQLGTAADMTEAVARHLGREPRDDDRGTRRREERAHTDYLHRSPLVGAVSPLAAPFRWRPTAEGVAMRGTFHAAYEGPPGYVHGGWIALAFDELLGASNIATGNPGMTGRLTVRYLRPTPLHRELELVGRTARVDGRRIVARGELRVDGEVTAEAEGLFVAIGPDLAARYFPAAEASIPGADPPQ